mmetsp:Transcript_29422/g.68957  ORF Transcript_29422/g.68957 Transcript_29422/m.68957 type:complete len:214 (+) Transcript_29422:235-876(+)
MSSASLSRRLLPLLLKRCRARLRDDVMRDGDPGGTASFSNPWRSLHSSIALDAKQTASPLPFHSATVMDWTAPLTPSASSSGSSPTKSSGSGTTKLIGLRMGSTTARLALPLPSPCPLAMLIICRRCRARPCLLRSPLPCVTTFKQTSRAGAARTSAVVPKETPSTIPRRMGCVDMALATASAVCVSTACCLSRRACRSADRTECTSLCCCGV